MNNDPFTKAARAYARERYPSGTDLDRDRRMVVDEFAEWARTHLAAQEPTDVEVLAALNAQGVVTSPKMHPAPSLDYWGDKPAEAMRAALSAARAARRDEKDTP